MSAPACGRCIAWDQAEANAGYCRAGLPSATALVIPVTSIATASQEARIQVVTAWPRTKGEDWCMGFQEKVAPQILAS